LKRSKLIGIILCLEISRCRSEHKEFNSSKEGDSISIYSCKAGYISKTISDVLKEYFYLNFIKEYLTRYPLLIASSIAS
jgi:hypothetical protein